MRRYLTGEKVEVLNTNGALEYSWHPARITGGEPIGDVYTVVYEGHENGMVEERVLAKCIRPRPPVVEFSNWSCGDLVHVFDNFAWKLATVLEVLDKKQFLVRVVGSMKDLKVGAAWIRVRHYWQDNRWTVVGKGASKSDKSSRPVIHGNIISDSRVEQRNTSVQAARRSSRQKSHNVPTKAVKRRAPSTQVPTTARRGLAKISRTVERNSPCIPNKNRTDACNGTGMRSKVTKEGQGTSRSRPPTKNSTLRKIDIENHEGSGLSSTGSCSINSKCSSHLHPTKCDENHCHNDDVSDAESRASRSLKPRNQSSGIFVFEKAVLDRPAQGCSLILRFRLKDPVVPGVAL
ncbi:unnamed protein product [Rhodiola kirilowii]